MVDCIEQNRAALSALCQKYGVRRLDLFGSAAGDTFRNAESDLDFLVLFDEKAPAAPADRYLGLLEELEVLFGRKVDLVDIRGARNPYFIANALKNRVMLYAA